MKIGICVPVGLLHPDGHDRGRDNPACASHLSGDAPDQEGKALALGSKAHICMDAKQGHVLAAPIHAPVQALDKLSPPDY